MCHSVYVHVWLLCKYLLPDVWAIRVVCVLQYRWLIMHYMVARRSRSLSASVKTRPPTILIVRFGEVPNKCVGRNFTRGRFTTILRYPQAQLRFLVALWSTWKNFAGQGRAATDLWWRHSHENFRHHLEVMVIGYLELQLNQVMETSQIMKLSKTTIDVLTQINGSDVATSVDIGEIPKIFYRVPVSGTSSHAKWRDRKAKLFVYLT